MLNVLKSFIRFYAPAFVSFLIVFCFTLYSFYDSLQSGHQRRARLFEYRTHQAQLAIRKRIDEYIQILKGVKGLYQANGYVTRNQWREYIATINVEASSPGIQGIGFAELVKKNELERHEQRIRAEGFPDYKVYPEGLRDEYTPIIFMEPFKGANLRVLGYDMWTDPIRRHAMIEARDTGLPIMSGKIKLSQETETDHRPGFLIYLPLYEKGKPIFSKEDRIRYLKGYVYSPFRAGNMIEAILQDDFKDIGIEIFDGMQLSRKNLLYNSDSVDNFRNPDHEQFYQLETIRIGEHFWKIYFTSPPGFGKTSETNQPYLILTGGLIISLLLFLTVLTLVNTRRRVINELEHSKELERKKDEFIGLASHELKTPLTSVKAYVQVLQRLLSEEDVNKTIFSYIEKTNNYIDKLNNLISDLLDATKIQGGKLQFNLSTFNFQELVEESIENMQNISKQKIIIDGKARCEVTGDRQRLEQVFINLLSNAIKYSPKSDKIVVHLSKHESFVTAGVQDFGIGISSEDLPKIFERFYRVEKHSTHFSGLGLGLYISYEIIRRHHGRLWAESELGKGSTFYFTIPARQQVRSKEKREK